MRDFPLNFNPSCMIKVKVVWQLISRPCFLDQQSRIQKLSSGLATQQFLTAHFYLVVYFHPDLTFQAVRSLRWKWIQFFWVQTLYWYSIFKHYFTIFWFLNTHLFIFFGRVWICFFYFISKRIASEFSCKKCISFT